MKIRRIILASTVAGLLTAILSNIPFISLLNYLCCGLVWLGCAFGVIYYNYLNGDDEEKVSIEEVENEIRKIREADAGLVKELDASLVQKLFKFNVSREEGMAVGVLTGVVAALISGIFYYVTITSMGFSGIQQTIQDLNLPFDPNVFNEFIETTGSEADAILLFTIIYSVINVLLYALIGVFSGILSVEFFSKLKIFQAKQ